MLKISKEEQKAIRTVVKMGEAFGYGNMISHLKSAATKSVMEKYKTTEENAPDLGKGYPVKMHLDLMNKGQWDESGEDYRTLYESDTAFSQS
jgi:hypothetical protein